MGRTVTSTVRYYDSSGRAFSSVNRKRERTEVRVTHFNSMVEAIAQAKERTRTHQKLKSRSELLAEVYHRALHGYEPRMKETEAQAAALTEAAIAEDPRLARRTGWVRSECGDVVDPALLMENDPCPCLDRRRLGVSEGNGGDVVRVVLSTDSNDFHPEGAAAIIAAIRIVQQWRTVEIWWQGSWLDNSGRNNGWVFLTPLSKGGTDWSRIDFVIGDQTRDSFSFSVMVVDACRNKINWNDCAKEADRSYLPDSHFVDHNGVRATGEAVAAVAAYWMGLPAMWSVRWEAKQLESAAKQEILEPSKGYTPATPEEQARWKREYEQREILRKKQEALRIKTRLGNVE